MKRILAFILVFSFMLSFAAAAFADAETDSAQAEQTPGLIHLSGEFGEPEIVRGYTNPFYLDRPVVNCTRVTLDLTVDELQGICTGNYYLYVKDTEGNWHHTSVFQLTRESLGSPVRYELTLDTVETFVAAALWPADKGMDFTATYSYDLYVASECVGDYSNSLPKPNHQASGANFASISVVFPTQPYSNPFFSDDDYVLFIPYLYWRMIGPRPPMGSDPPAGPRPPEPPAGPRPPEPPAGPALGGSAPIITFRRGPGGPIAPPPPPPPIVLS